MNKLTCRGTKTFLNNPKRQKNHPRGFTIYCISTLFCHQIRTALIYWLIAKFCLIFVSNWFCIQMFINYHPRHMVVSHHWKKSSGNKLANSQTVIPVIIGFLQFIFPSFRFNWITISWIIMCRAIISCFTRAAWSYNHKLLLKLLYFSVFLRFCSFFQENYKSYFEGSFLPNYSSWFAPKFNFMSVLSGTVFASKFIVRSLLVDCTLCCKKTFQVSELPQRMFLISPVTIDFCSLDFLLIFFM